MNSTTGGSDLNKSCICIIVPPPFLSQGDMVKCDHALTKGVHTLTKCDHALTNCDGGIMRWKTWACAIVWKM